MDTNEPGREPTEPTDAGPLLERFERWWAEEGVGTSPNYGQDSDECNRRLAEVAWLNGAYVARELDGQRPIPGSEVSRAEVLRMSTDTLLKAEAERLPDTPAPDEQDATLVKLIDLLTRTANAVKGQPGEMKQHGWADLPELCTALSARVAELEAELASRRAFSTDMVQTYSNICTCAAIDPDPHHRSAYQNVADTFRKVVERHYGSAIAKESAAPGKEPTSE